SSHGIQDRLRRNALVNGERDGIDDKLLRFALAGPLEPGLAVAQHVRELERLFLGQPTGLLRLCDQCIRALPAARRVGTQHGREMRIVCVMELRRLTDPPLRSQPCGWIVSPLRVIVSVVRNGRAAACARASSAASLICPVAVDTAVGAHMYVEHPGITNVAAACDTTALGRCTYYAKVQAGAAARGRPLWTGTDCAAYVRACSEPGGHRHHRSASAACL